MGVITVLLIDLPSSLPPEFLKQNIQCKIISGLTGNVQTSLWPPAGPRGVI
jgi:hypothetical protein